MIKRHQPKGKTKVFKKDNPKKKINSITQAQAFNLNKKKV